MPTLHKSVSSPIRVCITLGTRPEAIKLAPVIKLFQQLPQFTTYVVLTGQHREMVNQVMSLFEIKADYDLDIMKAGQTLTDITCQSLEGLEKLFTEIRPNIVISQGDTTTAFAAALAAFYQKIPLGHVEAGLRTDDLLNPFPEEANRRLISQIATLHFAPTANAVKNLENSGISRGIAQTGNTVIDSLLKVAHQATTYDIPGLSWKNHRVILATVHRRENWGAPLREIAHSFLQILERFPDTILLLPLHRNPIVRDSLRMILDSHPRALLVEPLNYVELVSAMKHCYLLLTDSGGLQEEAPALGKPVLVMRETTERPEAVTAGTAKLVGTSTTAIVKAASELLNDQDEYARMSKAINPFGDGHAAERIAECVTDYFSRH